MRPLSKECHSFDPCLFFNLKSVAPQAPSMKTSHSFRPSNNPTLNNRPSELPPSKTLVDTLSKMLRRAPHLFLKQTPLQDSSGGLDVFGLGQAMIDYSAMVSVEDLESFGVERGGRKVISVEEKKKIQYGLKQELEHRAGGSITNTLMALAQLASTDCKGLSLGFSGCVGSDSPGQLFTTTLDRLHIKNLAQDLEEGTSTGCVIVLTTPDAQRSFLVYPGHSPFHLTDSVKTSIASTRILFIEGYLLGLPGTLPQIKEALQIAKQHGGLVVLTGGDPQVISNDLNSFWAIVDLGVDIFLCNQAEAAALLQQQGKNTPIKAKEAAEKLSHYFPLCAVTDGPNGSYIAANNQIYPIEACPSDQIPVDTCGAGDVYAAGLLYGLLRGLSIDEMGNLASRSALSIINKKGAQLTGEEAKDIISDLTKISDFPKSNTIYMELEAIKQKV